MKIAKDKVSFKIRLAVFQVSGGAETSIRPASLRFRIRLLPIILHDVLQRVVEGVLTKQLAEIVATLFLDIVQHLGNHQANPLVLQNPEQRTQRVCRRVVHVIDRRGIEAEPA